MGTICEPGQVRACLMCAKQIRCTHSHLLLISPPLQTVEFITLRRCVWIQLVCLEHSVAFSSFCVYLWIIIVDGIISHSKDCWCCVEYCLYQFSAAVVAPQASHSHSVWSGVLLSWFHWQTVWKPCLKQYNYRENSVVKYSG